MENIKDTSDQEDKTRREFYREYSNLDDEIPEGWNFENRTIYSNQPTLQKNITKDVRLTIRFIIDNNNITIMSSKQETKQDSEEYDLLREVPRVR